MSKKRTNRFIRVKHPAIATEVPLVDSTHVLICPKCLMKRYVDERFVQSMEDMKQITGVEAALPMHRPCNSFMTIEEVKERIV